jgi:hypothetical protein
MFCVVRYRSLRRAHHSSRGVLPNVVHCCVWSRNLRNYEVMPRVGPRRHRREKYTFAICSGKFNIRKVFPSGSSRNFIIQVLKLFSMQKRTACHETERRILARCKTKLESCWRWKRKYLRKIEEKNSHRRRISQRSVWELFYTENAFADFDLQRLGLCVGHTISRLVCDMCVWDTSKCALAPRYIA